jgi:hypothetical protein
MGKITYKEEIENGVTMIKEYHEVVVHTFSMGDVDDPDLYASQPIWQWQQTEQGKFVMENAVEEPYFNRQIDHFSYGYKFSIVAKLEKKKLSEFYIKWGNPNKNYLIY